MQRVMEDPRRGMRVTGWGLAALVSQEFATLCNARGMEYP